MRQLFHQLVVLKDLPYFMVTFSQIIITKRILRSGLLYPSIKIANKSNQFLGIQSLDGQLPEQIGSVIHLRFLSLKKTCIRELPSSIVNLVYLETLNLETIEELSWESTVLILTVIWKMKKLRHLYLPKSCNYLTDEKLQLENLSNLQTLVFC
ncbi:putative disease resistance protein rxw24l [Quercus suber]|uniref:Disease resistance protein rxw24l n=1 Tax=Quercus suber TaxID=58331 RepID=A0AAW0KKX5_QUESU